MLNSIARSVCLPIQPYFTHALCLNTQYYEIHPSGSPYNFEFGEVFIKKSFFNIKNSKL